MADKNEMVFNHEYVKSPNYFETYANGFWGGLNSNNKIQISFYEDQLDMPESVEMVVEKIGSNAAKVKDEKITPSEPKRVRVIKGTITFDVDKLDVFMKWIQDRRTAIETIMKQE